MTPEKEHYAPPRSLFAVEVDKTKIVSRAAHIKDELERLWGQISSFESGKPAPFVNVSIGQSMENMSLIIREYE